MNDAHPSAERVLVADDDGAFRRVWSRLLEAEGYGFIGAASAPEAEASFAKERPRLVVLDLMLPPSGLAEEGARLLDLILTQEPLTKVIIASGSGDTNLALTLVRRGAYDFVAKPVEPEVLLAVLARAQARLALEDRVRELEQQVATAPERSGLIGRAPAFESVCTLAERVAGSDIPVLMTGESGTGKEVFARFLHRNSRRAPGPFVAVNCGAISPQLLESTLFGHKKGSFTGAVADARGLFVEANGGTLFLDEIGDLALDLQVKLLRALESGEVLPVGASQPVQTQVRIVSATNRPLADMVKDGRFRDDLYWRIRGIELQLPRLADRPGDVLLLAKHFLNQARALVPGVGEPMLSDAAKRALENYAWPGNLRELRNEMQRALVMAGSRREVLVEDLSPALRPPNSPTSSEPGDSLEAKIAALEQREIVAALEATQGNKSQAAGRLGLSRQGLLNKLARYGIRG